MKKLTLTSLFLFFYSISFSQNREYVDSLKHQLAIVKQDTSRVLLLTALCDQYRSTDSAQFFGQRAFALAQKIDFPKGEVRALTTYARVFYELGNSPKSLQMLLKALQLAEENNLEEESAWTLNQMGNLYGQLNDFKKSLGYYKQSLAIYEKYQNKVFISQEKMQIGRTFSDLNQLDSALYYEMQAYTEMMQRSKNGEINPLVFRNLARIHLKLGNASLAIEYAHKALNLAYKNNTHFIITGTLIDLGNYYQKIGQRDSSIYYAKLGLAEAQRISRQQSILQASTLLSELYEPIDTKEAFRYYKMATTAKDKLLGAGNIQAIQEMLAQNKERKKEAENAKITYENRLKLYASLAVLAMFLIISFILYRNNRQKQKANNLLHRQKEEINRQRENIEKALTELKSTQAQLIQSEKLASLGELTAGIAHEIQNPLNFVNNFSEMSVELANELKEEAQKPEIDKELIIDLASDLSANQEKINHHGKRASSIVSGMLEHSRASTGERAMTDINKLADEYLRLSYHGIRAKDNSFNSDYKTDFDESLPKIEVIPQDMGRVLLNLINNSFWAVKTVEKPLVVVKTEQSKNQLIIKVTDNGIGMTNEVKAKIFQPFFTTKPTGQGTGLGLSLAYDIVTKGHGGTIEVESVEGEGTTFVIKLPISIN